MAISVAEFNENTLDVFLRLLLPHLTHFRQIVDHPGFDFGSLQVKNQMMLIYLMSITAEVDPQKRVANLRHYKEQVEAEFRQNPAPDEQ